MTHKQSSTTLDSYDYDFDGMSRITKITNGIDGVANYTYDKSSQLTGADNPSPLADETSRCASKYSSRDVIAFKF